MERLVRQEIGRRGPLSFAEFVDLALYHPAYGYYGTAKSPRGRGGDYFTSLQVGPLFPRIVADGLLALWDALDSEQFTIVEYGAGFGEMAEGVLEAFKAAGRLKGARYIAVERGRIARDTLWRRLSRFGRCQIVGSLDEAEWTGALEGCVLSNEFFDALPFRRLRRRGTGWTEVRVGLEGDSIADVEVPWAGDPWPGVTDWAEGQEVELREGIGGFYEEWARWFSRGYVLTFDYGYPRASLHDPLRANGTWQCFHRHAVSAEPYRHLGAQDITAHVDFTQLAEEGAAHGFSPALFSSQGVALAHWGAARIEADLKRLEGPDRTALMRSVQQLMHPSAMGSAFSTLVQVRDAALPALFEAVPSRLRRLGLGPRLI